MIYMSQEKADAANKELLADARVMKWSDKKTIVAAPGSRFLGEMDSHQPKKGKKYVVQSALADLLVEKGEAVVV